MTIGFDASRAQLEEPAGPENYTYNLLESLLRIDRHNFYRLYYRPRSFGLDLHASFPNFELYPISWPKLWTQVGLSLECLRRPPDVLFIPAHTIPIIRRPSLKTVVTIHDVGLQPFLEQYQRWWWRLYGGRISNYAARNATHLIAVSESTKRDLVGKLGVSPEKISVVYEGVDHRRFTPEIKNQKSKIKKTKEKYGIEGDYLLFVGTIQPRKNLVRLIEAFSKVAAKDFKLVLVGKKGWLADKIYAAPKEFGVNDKVKFSGYVPTDDVATLLGGAEAFLFPSLYEGFGLVILEALACGCPVMTSNISSLPEVVGEAGILVDPYSVEDIAAGISNLLSLNDAARNNLVQRGLKQAQKFSWEKTAQQTLKVLYDVVAG